MSPAVGEPLRPVPDVIPAECRILFVGINPGRYSSLRGHHFAGPGNRFYDALHQSGLTPRRLHWSEDRRLPEWGIGITNIVDRPTPSSSDLTRDEFISGRRQLRAKILQVRPAVVALVGITVYRQFFDVYGPVQCGLATETIDGIPVFVLPNPSARNRHFSPEEIVALFTQLSDWVAGAPSNHLAEKPL